jgi:membrane-bound lytic murein transglycosylase D
LDLRKQTEDYVPFFMAATIISKNPGKFGFDNIRYQDRWDFDLVEIDRCLDLKVIARAIGCSVDDLKKLNPELLRRFTPPNKKNYALRIPKGKKREFLAAYESMPSSKETSFVRHNIRRGETVSSIARKYGVSQYAIFEANNLSRRSKIYAGKTLIVPVPNDRDYARKTHQNYEADGNIYVVRAGDTVWDIARAFGVSTSSVRRWNNLDRRARIHVGQKLYVGQPGNTGSAAYAAKGNGSKGSGAATKTYKVRKGDTLWDIARRHGMTTAQLKQVNGLGRSSHIYPGQKLSVSVPVGSGEYTVYTVKRGDTLSDIARLFRVSVSKLMAWNGVTNPRSIPIGLKLKIYNN